MPLVVKKLDGETWRQAAIRYAVGYGLEKKIGENFDALVEGGVSEDEAAFEVCVEEGIADFEDRL